MEMYEKPFEDYWKTYMMDARLKVLGLNEVQKQEMKIAQELAFMAGYNYKQK